MELPAGRKKLHDGTEIKLDSQVPKEALTRKNQFAKLNFSQTTQNTITIRRKKQPLERARDAVSEASKLASFATSEHPAAGKPITQARMDVGGSTVFSGEHEPGEAPPGVIDWLAKQTRPGTNLRSQKGEGLVDDDLLGGGDFGKIYLRSLKKQAEDEALSQTQRQDLLRTMGDD